MHRTVHQGALLDYAAPLIVQGIWQDEPLPEEIAALLEPDDFQGKEKHLLLLYPRGAFAARRLLLLGLGERATASAERIRQAGALAARKVQELQLASFAIALPRPDTLSIDTAAQALSEGMELGLYRYLEHKTSPAPEQAHEVQEVTLVVQGDVQAVQEAAMRGSILAQGVQRARDLANAPSNVLTPLRMGEVAREIGTRSDMQVTLLQQDELVAQGFGGLLAVARGSAQPPCFIVMEHGRPSDGTPTICLVGKGVTFDTGGISIKPAANMEAMKMDMGGAASVLGAMQVIGDLQLPLHVVALVGAVENMPDGNAYKPGDVITMLSGKTVEIINTDAEGRMVLADALFYAQRYQPQAIIDLATLTGAMVVALGSHASGLMSNDQPLAERLLRAGQATSEPVWQMPLWDAYREMIKSEVADVKHVAGRNGGAIVAAAFLETFVGDYSWAHLDIAGTVWSEGTPRPYESHGATGVGVRLLLHMLESWTD
jgi:leucyl aminopeptidase